MEIDLNWNLGRAWTRNPLNNQEHGDTINKKSATTGVLDHLRTNLESDWHTALRHAYLGPRIDDLQHGQLPDCFEADERATQSTNEVLQLVSGRQELGNVRLRTAGMLTESEKKAWLGQGQCNHREVKKDPALLAAFEVADKLVSAGTSIKSSNEVVRADDERLDTSGALLQRKNGKIQEEQPAYSEIDSKYNTSTTSNSTRQPQILDLYLNDQVIATAISRPASTPLDKVDDVNMAPIDGPMKEKKKKDDDDDNRIQGILTTYFYRGEILLGQLIEEEDSLATSRRYSASKLLDSSGNHVFSIIRNVTPLVRHVTFVEENACTSKTQEQNLKFGDIYKRKKTVVARCQRAWLPPSSLWLFKPRSYDHDIGGWIITWAGESQKMHPQWLDPSVLTLVAALDTLDYEKAKQQPYGLFERLKRGRGVYSGGDGGGGGGGGGWRKVLNWVRDMRRFHRGGGNI